MEIDMNDYKRTDLASELRTEENSGCPGISYSERSERGFEVSVFDILDERGENAVNKPRGRYITVQVGKIWLESDERLAGCEELLAHHIKELMCNSSGKGSPESILVCGLGNRYITSDALGSEVLNNLIVTRHLKEENSRIFAALGGRSVSALAPGVVGQTGIETLELIRGAVGSVKPDIVIVIDALAASELDHLATTVQITDTGIAPGSGIGNKRRAINRETLGCPVIAIGVPTVVESSTLVYAALSEAGIEEIDTSLVHVLENKRGFFVTPKESDIVTEELSKLISNAINLALS
jgi:spore protease